MKRVWFCVLAATLTLASALPPGGAGSSASPLPLANQSVSFAVINDGSGNYTVTDPGSITLYKSKGDKIKWCVTFIGAPPSRVEIAGFRGTGSTAPSKKPFADANTYNVYPTDPTCSKTSGSIATGAADGDQFKYTITVFVNDVEKGKLDPQVIIGG